MIFETVLSHGGVWLWEKKLGPILANQATKRIKKKWEEFRWDKAEQDYLARLYNNISTTRILGKQKPILIDSFYTDVYVLDKQSAFVLFDLSANGNSADSVKKIDKEKIDKRRRAEDLLEHESKLYILGKPGAGKTTFLKHLAILACKGEINKTPIFIPLKEWVESGESLDGFISTSFDVCGFPDAEKFIHCILDSGEALVLFDGLDEVNQENEARNKTILDIKRFSQKYSKSTICLTCRVAANEYTFDGFEYIEISDFSSDQKVDFIDRWFQESEDLKARFYSDWNSTDNGGIRELGATPLLLTLICLAYEETLNFPSRRVDLYQEALDALLKKWDSSRGVLRHNRYKSLSIERKKQMLAGIAHEHFIKGEYLFPRKTIEKDIGDFLARLPGDDEGASKESSDMLEAIEAQHGLLSERAKDIYSFSHLTLQEFFAARYILENQAKGTLEQLISLAAQDKRWREVFLMVASLLDDATDFFRESLSSASNFISDSHYIKCLVSYLETGWVSVTPIPTQSRDESLVVFQVHWEQIEDACFELAGQLDVGHLGDPTDARTRARKLSKLISTIPSFDEKAPIYRVIEELKKSSVEQKRLLDYLRFSSLVIEAIRLASVSKRHDLENSVLTA